VIRRTDRPRMAADTASTFSIPPKIQRPTWWHAEHDVQ